MTHIFAIVRGPMQPRPFPLAPLLAAAEETSLRRLALRLGLHASTLSKAQGTGLTWQQADEWSIRMGKHPAEVWTSWWAAIDEEDPA